MDMLVHFISWTDRGILTVIMHRITTKAEVASLGTILGIWAHPDDETWTSAGLMAMAADNGQRVTCITATYGEDGVQDPGRWPADHLAEIRKHELEAACKVIGVTKHYYLGYRDGYCKDAAPDAAVKRLAEIINQEQPDTILTFGPTGTTGHPDHITVSHWTNLAVKAAEGKSITVYHSVHSKQWYEHSGKRLDAQFNIFFNIDSPPLVDEAKADISLHLDDTYCERKKQALAVQPSQTDAMFRRAQPEDIKDLACLECFMRAA